ncbi:unnamed protein product, partial [Iphiclides podalirius]
MRAIRQVCVKIGIAAAPVFLANNSAGTQGGKYGIMLIWQLLQHSNPIFECLMRTLGEASFTALTPGRCLQTLWRGALWKWPEYFTSAFRPLEANRSGKLPRLVFVE